MPREYDGKADDIIEHIEIAQSELNKAISKINGRKIWLKLSCLYKLASILGKLEYVKDEMKSQERMRKYYKGERE